MAGVGALLLGLLFWITQISFITIHMLFGVTLALSLLVLSIVMVCIRGARLLGAMGIVYAFILPAFGLTQASLLIGSSMHWLIQAAHLCVGIGSVTLVQGIYVRYRRLRPTVTGVAEPPQAARRWRRKEHV
jgi:hypothetical protein